jgi:putative intracellular protease/amidase
MKKKILLIVTGHYTLGDTGRATGLSLPTLALPYEVFLQAGYQVAVASPQGGPAPLDPQSILEELKPYMLFTQQTLPLHSIMPEAYDAFFVVGGHGVMWDLPEHPALQHLLPSAFDKGKVIAAVCHGPAALVHLKQPDGHLLLKGKKVTGFSNHEEAAIGLAQIVPFLLEDTLQATGAVYSCVSNGQAHVVIDGHLVTGQNPASARGVGEAVRDLLQQPAEEHDGRMK